MAVRKLVLCMHWGTKYNQDYANRLYAMVRRHLTGELQFVCFTDNRIGLRPEIDARPLPPLPGVPEYLSIRPWRKLSLWQRNLGADLEGRDALFLDLDLLVTGSLDDFFTYEPGKYCVIHNWTEPNDTVGNTSVFRYEVGSHPEVFERFIADPVGNHARHRASQRYTSRVLAPQGVQVFWPKAWCRSFKEELLPPFPLRLLMPAALPRDARIVAFHGKPDPHEAAEGRWPAPWYEKLFKITRPVPWIAEHWRDDSAPSR